MHKNIYFKYEICCILNFFIFNFVFSQFLFFPFPRTRNTLLGRCPAPCAYGFGTIQRVNQMDPYTWMLKCSLRYGYPWDLLYCVPSEKKTRWREPLASALRSMHEAGLLLADISRLGRTNDEVMKFIKPPSKRFCYKQWPLQRAVLAFWVRSGVSSR